MKNFKMNTSVQWLLAFIFVLTLGELAAQAPPPPPGSNNPAPFGFVELLIGAGALYGGKKAYDKRKEQKH